MIAWVMYDITEDPLRNKIAAIYLDYGLFRIQKSVFCGETDKRTLDLVKERITSIFTRYSDEGNVLVFTLCDTCMKDRTLIGKTPPAREVRLPPVLIIG
jgi:CRISPR-associated protein Cas2